MEEEEEEGCKPRTYPDPLHTTAMEQVSSDSLKLLLSPKHVTSFKFTNYVNQIIIK